LSRLSRLDIDCRHRPVRHRARGRPCAYQRSPSVSPRVRDPDAPAWRLPERDRRTAGASEYRGYEDLRKGGHRSIALARIALAGRCGMNTLREAVQEYLSLRRSLGFKLREDGLRLLDFVAFMERRKASYITHELALAWAQNCTAVPSEQARRLGFV